MTSFLKSGLLENWILIFYLFREITTNFAKSANKVSQPEVGFVCCGTKQTTIPIWNIPPFGAESTLVQVSSLWANY